MPKSKQSRHEFFEDLTRYCDGSFAILIVGRPGISKTRILRDWAKTIDKNKHYFVSDDLALRLKKRDDPIQILGRQELLYTFPFKESVFDSGYDGISHRDKMLAEFHEELEKSAILVFDDLDYLPFSTQVQLFDFLATDSSGKNLSLNDNLDKQATLPQIIAMVNRPLPELYAQHNRHFRLLLERLAQQVFFLPEIRNYTRSEKEEAFRSVWQDLKFVDPKRNPVHFGDLVEPKFQTQLFDWIDSLTLEGNYRDLQVIAISLFREMTLSKQKTEDKILESIKSSYEISRFHVGLPDEHT